MLEDNAMKHRTARTGTGLGPRIPAQAALPNAFPVLYCHEPEAAPNPTLFQLQAP